MRYIVLRTVVDLDAGEDGTDGTHVDQPPLLCATRGDAERALAEWVDGTPEGRDWSVWEILDGKCRQRAIVFKSGNPEIQSSREGTG